MDLGTDISNSWSIGDNGDLKLVSDEENIGQSILNRLSTFQPNFDVFYEQYGGFLSSYFGRRKTQETLDFMKIEIETILDQDPRIQDYELNLSYNNEGNVCIDLNLNYENYEDVDLNLVLGVNGLEVIEDEEEE